MKNQTNEQIEQAIKALVSPLNNSYGDLTVSVEQNTGKMVLVEVVSMYESPCTCSEELLTQIKDILDATYIEKYDDISEGGCETCDYWSRYGFAVRAWD